MGDLTFFDLYNHPMPELKTVLAVGWSGSIPTATYSTLGKGELFLGPSAAILNRSVPKWLLGFLFEAPFSVQSDAYTIQFQPIAVRYLPNEWYVGVGDLLMLFDDEQGNYDIPLSLRIGKVVKVGKQPLNIFLQPQFTPDGFHSGQATQWGIKLSVTFLFPGAKIQDPILGDNGLFGGCGRMQ